MSVCPDCGRPAPDLSAGQVGHVAPCGRSLGVSAEEAANPDGCRGSGANPTLEAGAYSPARRDTLSEELFATVVSVLHEAAEPGAPVILNAVEVTDALAQTAALFIYHRPDMQDRAALAREGGRFGRAVAAAAVQAQREDPDGTALFERLGVDAPDPTTVKES